MSTVFLCPACEVITSSTSKLQCHLERHLGQRPFSCKLCPKTYVIRFEANRHIKEKHPGEDVEACRIQDPEYQENPVIAMDCLRCGGAIKSREDLRHHALKHSGAKVEIEHSRREPKSHSQRRRRTREDRHLRRVATLHWKCFLCGAMQSDLTELSIHLNEHVGLLRYSCRRCERTFTSRDEAIRHTIGKTDHDGAEIEMDAVLESGREIRHSCLQCGEQITSVQAVDTHVRMHCTVNDPDSVR